MVSRRRQRFVVVGALSISVASGLYTACSSFHGSDIAGSSPGVDAGTSSTTTRPGLSDCGAALPIDTKADPLNCGGCGAACKSAGEVCELGKCVPMTNLELCDTGNGLVACEQHDPRACNGGAACVNSQTCNAMGCLGPAELTDAGGCNQLRCTVVGSLAGCFSGDTALNCGGCDRICAIGQACASKSCRSFTPSLSCTDSCTGGADSGVCCGAGTVCCLPQNASHQAMCVEGDLCPTIWR